ncbi:recombinase family protein [uncultured Intestinimonas sp.]|uniref:recombinase family protein n=1 Tax=uncultured Intestinimonas sp. TaxID=1689265 RepID=UPI00344EFCCB
MGQPPYGYIKDSDDPKHWIVDEEAAQVVRRIYSMTLEGYGTEQIAASLDQDGILTPRAYWLKKGIKRPGKGKEQPPTKWNSSSVTKTLSLQEYCGDILNFKTYSKSYKNKKRLENDRENWVIFKDVHDPIIERAVFEQVQQKRGKSRKRRTHEGERNMFSGLLVCADCGHNLHFHFNQGTPDIKYFNCSNYKGNRGGCYTRARKLTPRMLNELIEKIEVFNAEKIDGVWEQRLRIHYNCVGVIEIPELIPLPAPEVSVNTRKGVVVNYAPSTIAG